MTKPSGHVAGSRQNNLSLSGYNANIVNRAERVGHMQRAIGIILPFAVHEKPVMISAGLEMKRRFPYSSPVFLHGNGMFLPLGKTSGQKHRLRVGRNEGEFPSRTYTCRFHRHLYPAKHSPGDGKFQPFINESRLTASRR